MKSSRNKADIAQRQRMDQRQLSTDFLDRALEWRRIFAETWGTFLLVVVAAGGAVVAARSGRAVTPGMTVVAPGLMVTKLVVLCRQRYGQRRRRRLEEVQEFLTPIRRDLLGPAFGHRRRAKKNAERRACSGVLSH